jgi:Ca2+-binding RTX toxin-like protein
MSAGSYSDFTTALGAYESGNNYAFVSSLGYLGRFQFAEEALTDVGFYVPDGSGNTNDFVGHFTDWAASTYGVTDKTSFLASPKAQDDAAQAWFAKIISDVQALGLDKYLGQTVGGVQITTSGLIAGTHLVGVWNLKAFLESGGSNVAHDGYGTTVADYLGRFAGYDTPFDLGQSASAPAAASPSSASANVLTASAAGGQLDGGSGSETITGAMDSANEIRGMAGDDVITGGHAFNRINGNLGNDTVTGQSQSGDELAGGQGNDLIGVQNSGAGNQLFGNKGNDTLNGGGYADTLHGGQADDLIQGGGGGDWLTGDLGSDTLTGGAGADTFAFARGGAADRITDFNVGEGDHVVVQGGAGWTLSQSGADVVVSLDSGDQLTLAGVRLDALGSGWIGAG